MPVRSFRSFVEQKLGKFPHFLIYAIFEWVVIILLFIDGFLAFLSNEIARFFELRIPCLLCTRIDHILVHRNSNFYYNDSICDVHKKDISTLAYCHVHTKLSDIRSMCEGCLLSFATEKDSEFDKYKPLVGMLHKDVDFFVEDERKLLMRTSKFKDDLEIFNLSGNDKKVILRCSCCGEPMKSKPSVKFNRSLSMSAPAPSPSPRAPLFSGRNEDGSNVFLPHVKYTELKLMSDDESEVTEEEDAPNVDNHEAVTEDVKAVAVPVLPDTEEIKEDYVRTPIFSRGNRFFGIPLSDSAQMSPRWAHRRKQTVDKLEFILESNDEGDQEDDDTLTRLKRQIRNDRKVLAELSMELDEERSASAVAANNAMAMITRLQAEKSSVQMEALQYQRMMEEQAEYDQEALQVMKDLLFKREEDIKALESELELYREKYGNLKKIGSEICEFDVDDDYQDMRSQAERSDTCSSSSGNENEGRHERSMENNVELSLDFERERSNLLGLLKNLEEKINAPMDERSNLEEIVADKNEDEGKVPVRNENKAVFTREVSFLRERLRAIEADSGFLKHAAMTLQRGGDEGTKLLTEIAQHLKNLRQPVKSPSEDTNA